MTYRTLAGYVFSAVASRGRTLGMFDVETKGLWDLGFSVLKCPEASIKVVFCQGYSSKRIDRPGFGTKKMEVSQLRHLPFTLDLNSGFSCPGTKGRSFLTLQSAR